MEINQSATKRRRFSLITVAAIAGVALVVTLMVMSSRNASRPQLNVTNTGSTAVSARHGSDEFIIQPAQTWDLRYSVGDSLTLFVIETSKSRTVVLDREGRGTVTQPVKFQAEVNADGQDISFRFTTGE